MSSNIRITKICQQCGVEFIAKTTVTKYCGDNCSKRAYKARKREESIEKSNKEVEQIKNAPFETLKSKEFLSLSECATLIGVSRRTIYRLIEKDIIKPTKLLGRTIIPRKIIDSLFQI